MYRLYYVCIGYGSRDPGVYFKSNTKQYSIFSPDLAVSCVADTPVSNDEKHIFCSIALNSIISLLAVDAFR